MQDVAASGYVQDEVFLAGSARSFTPTAVLDSVADGRWNAAPSSATAPYKVRLIIRRPRDPAKFNGIVLVEWLNVSSGYDADTFDGFGPHFMRDGYAYVGVSAQAAGVNHLSKNWDPKRYASLTHPGDSYSYDIFSQAARAIRAGNPAPLGQLTPRIKGLVAWGGSQSGARLLTYFNAVHSTARVIDGFVPFIAPGGAPLSQEPLRRAVPPSGAKAVVRTDLGTPVLVELSESEFLRAAYGLHRQPDSATFRLWEYTGTSHANQVGVDDTMARLKANGIPLGVFPPCGDPPLNDLSDFPVWHAMLQAMSGWVLKGVAPSHAPRVDMMLASDSAAPASIVRDPATGIANGGIRLPDIAVPTRTLTGTRPAAALAKYPNCALFGAVDRWNGDGDPWDHDPALKTSPTPEPTLAANYGTSARYVSAVKASAAALQAKGFILDDDARAYVTAARKVDIR